MRKLFCISSFQVISESFHKSSANYCPFYKIRDYFKIPSPSNLISPQNCTCILKFIFLLYAIFCPPRGAFVRALHVI